jgi:hypothetical protein
MYFKPHFTELVEASKMPWTSKLTHMLVVHGNKFKLGQPQAVIFDMFYYN